MEFYSQTFFCGKEEEGPICHISYKAKGFWPITAILNTSTENRFVTPYITINLKSLKDLVSFKNSVVSQFDKVMREISND